MEEVGRAVNLNQSAMVPPDPLKGATRYKEKSEMWGDKSRLKLVPAGPVSWSLCKDVSTINI